MESRVDVFDNTTTWPRRSTALPRTARNSFHGLNANRRPAESEVSLLAHSSRITVALVRADGPGTRFDGGALDAAEAPDRFVDEPGGVGAGRFAEDLVPVSRT